MTTATQDLDEYCRHELPRRTCGLCNGVAERQRREYDLEVERVLALPGWFLARYGGRCAICNTSYGSSSPIRRKTNLDRTNVGSVSYIAMCCAPGEGEE